MRREQLLEGLKDSFPILIGYFPVGLAFGVLAGQAGLSTWEIFMMSLMVYAGASQFIGATLIAGGATISTIVLTTFFVNLRHLLMSASLSPYTKNIPSKALALLSFGLTDETFAVSVNKVKQSPQTGWYFLSLFVVAYLTWIFSTVLGGAVGNLIPEPEKFGLDFALTAMFIGLLMLQITDIKSVWVAVIAGSLALIFKILSDGHWSVILATVLAATIGVLIEEWTKKSSRSFSV